MNRFKIVLCLIVSMLVITSTSYAIEVSVGASVGLGPSFLRGEDAKVFDDLYRNSYGDPMGVHLYPQFDVMVEFLPFLALETGLGSKIISSVSYQEAGNPDSAQANFQKFLHINIPLMLKGAI